MNSQPFCAGPLREARVLVIGHDPRLRRSDTRAGYAFFGDYHFRPPPPQKSELRKRELASAVYDYIGYLTSGLYRPEEIILTNLCNQPLPHAPRGKVVYIPEQVAAAGIDDIRQLIASSKAELIFAMSQQVNYWLQALDFYSPIPAYLERAAPAERGRLNQPPYYQPRKDHAFPLICGQLHEAAGCRLFPIPHVRSWPLNGAFSAAYSQPLARCAELIRRDSR
jgi:hypothetical protein